MTTRTSTLPTKATLAASTLGALLALVLPLL